MFRVERDVLTEAVTWVARWLPARPPVPVLACVRIVAEDGTLTISAFDYEVSAKITVAAEVTEPGEVLVSGRMLADICRNLPNKTIEVTSANGKVQVTCGASRFTLREMPVAEYPSLPAIPEQSGTIAGDLFTQAVSQVAIAADRGDALPILTAVKVEIDGDTMTLLATDRYRLATRELSWNPTNPSGNQVALIPARQLGDIAKTLGSGTVSVSLGAAGEGMAGFEAGERHSTTRLLDGEYPKISAIFPTSTDTEALVSTKALEEAVRRVSLVAPDINTPVRLTFTEGAVTVDLGDGHEDSATESVEAQVTGPDIEIAFRPGYLLDGLHAVGTPVSRLAFTQPSRPAVLTGQQELEDELDTSYRYILMPMRFPK